MSKAAVRPPSGQDLRETDLYLWTQAQAALLRAGRWQEADLHQIAEEIDSLGGSQESKIRNRLAILIQHLLKWEVQPQKRKYGWRASIVEQRLQIDGLIEVSPSLEGWPDLVLAKAYQLARVRAAAETGLSERGFPDACPYSMQQIRDDGFHPGPIEPEVL